MATSEVFAKLCQPAKMRHTRSGKPLRDGSRVAVVGAGPSGSMFSYFLLNMAESIGLELELDPDRQDGVLDRLFSSRGPQDAIPEKKLVLLAFSLDAPVKRLAALDTPVPFAPSLEEYVLPDAGKIAKAMRELIRY